MKSKSNLVFTKSIRLTACLLAVGGLALHAPAQDTNSNLTPDSNPANSNFQALQAAADQGDPKAQLDLAADYAHGTGVPRDYAKAADYLRRSAEQGNAEAQMALGSYYGRGRGVPQNLALAVQWYRKAADQGNAVAQYAMGNFYATGRGVTNDMNQAIQWWQKAAEQDQTDAEAALGELYLTTTPLHGTNYLNYAEAVRWLRRAAAHGSATAMNNLGVAYENGFGVNLDNTEAGKWYRQAAEQGDAHAQANLGQLYMEGRGVPLDLVQAYKWLKISAMQNNPWGTHGFNDITSRQLLKPEQLAQAEQMVQDFMAQHGQKPM